MNIFWDFVILLSITFCLLCFVPNVFKSKSEKFVESSKKTLTKEDIKSDLFYSTLSNEIEVSQEAIVSIENQSTPQPSTLASKDETKFTLHDEFAHLNRFFEQAATLETEVKSAMKAEVIKFTDIRPRETEALLDELEQRLREGTLE